MRVENFKRVFNMFRNFTTPPTILGLEFENFDIIFLKLKQKNLPRDFLNFVQKGPFLDDFRHFLLFLAFS